MGGGGWFKEGCRWEPWSVHVTEVADWLVLHDAQVVHGAAEGDLDGLADAGRASFHHFDLVDGLVHPERNHFGSRKPLPEGGKTFCSDIQSRTMSHFLKRNKSPIPVTLCERNL